MADNGFMTTTETTTHKFVIKGFKITTRTPRRYAVVVMREEAVVNHLGTYMAFARVEKRTDNLVTARRAAQAACNFTVKISAYVVDLTTGEAI